jgi:hypothetical protein
MYADGHAKSVKKGQMSWCRNIYASPAKIQDGSDSWLFGNGAPCPLEDKG